MKKIKTIIGIACVAGTYFTAHYASTVEVIGMSFWGFIITCVLLIAGLSLIVEDNSLNI